MFVDHKPHKIGYALAMAVDRKLVGVRKQAQLRFSHPRPPTGTSAMSSFSHRPEFYVRMRSPE